MPDSFLWDIADFLEVNLPTLQASGGQAVMRPLVITDPDAAVGVAESGWANEDIYEIGRQGPLEGTYSIDIWHQLRFGDKDQGSLAANQASRNIRLLLAHDTALLAVLAANVDSLGPLTERFLRMKIATQRRHEEQAFGGFIYLSVTTIKITTETT